ncbi:VP3 [Cat Tien Hospitalitermes Lispi-like virus]|uniref:VP3 n=1 Tax=Cat Tien Hospitalitermes Lispi-like virus TaxID=2952743 RepID=A0AAE9NIN0_9MONO|nr:VP3 [Cat Tien Hospitalitermes Lispi-like virus]
MSDQLQLSPGSALINVDLLVKIKDKSSGLVYNGLINIGTKPPLRSYQEDTIRREILRWVQWIRFTKPPLSKMVICWNVPADQQYVVTSKTNGHLVIDIPKLMGISPQEIFNAQFEMHHIDVIFTALPKDSFEIN